MSFNIGHVDGGTNAGWRKVNLEPPHDDWVCPTEAGGCGKANAYFWLNCPNCGQSRPERD